MSKLTPEAIHRHAVHKAAHANYSDARHKWFMRECAKIPICTALGEKDQLTASNTQENLAYLSFVPTTSAHSVFTSRTHGLMSGTTPTLALADDAKRLRLVCAQIAGYGGQPRDMGKAAFLHATHCTDTKVIYLIEGVGATHGNGDPMMYLVSGQVLDTPGLRKGNEEYLRTEIRRQEEVMLNSQDLEALPRESCSSGAKVVQIDKVTGHTNSPSRP